MNLVEGEVIWEVEEIEGGEGWWSGVGEGGKQGMFPAEYVEIRDVTGEEAPPETPYEPEPEPEAAEPEVDKGIVATALYDYDAAEDNELSFREGETVVEIEPTSEEWWSGFVEEAGGVRRGAGDGAQEKGLFPANYVEVVE